MLRLPSSPYNSLGTVSAETTPAGSSAECKCEGCFTTGVLTFLVGGALGLFVGANIGSLVGAAYAENRRRVRG